MDAKEVRVQFRGFHPSEAFEAHVNDVLEEVYEEAPYGANVLATITREGNFFKGHLKVNSAAGPFFAVAADSSPRGVMDFLFQRIRRKLAKWKDRRFRVGPPGRFYGEADAG